MTMYAVTGQVITHGEHGFSGSVGVPAFYLDSRVQGILDVTDAVATAKRVLNPLGVIPDQDMHLTVCEVPADWTPLSAAEREHNELGPRHARWCAGASVH